MLSGRILVVDDDPALGPILVALLKQGGMFAEHVASAAEALVKLDQAGADVVLSDFSMPGMGGLELLAAVRQRHPDIPFVLLTAHGSVSLAVQAMKAGASDFLMKPFDRDEVLHVCRKALVVADYTSQQLSSETGACEARLIGQSAAQAELSRLIGKAARSLSTVLIRGESGTGKELVAQAVHEGSARAQAPLVKLNCASLPDALLESELFGYEKGAFTGASTRKPGRFELAHGGSIFLDEIGDITPSLQVKLLRVLQERQIERLGGTKPIHIDVRFLAATHRNLEELISKGQFREDLYYRLNVIPLFVPPLRERLEDIDALVESFRVAVGSANGKLGVKFTEAAVARLKTQEWPGNVRQLQNFVERLIVLADDLVIDEDCVDRELGRSGTPSAPQFEEPRSFPEAVDAADTETKMLEDALRKAGGNRALAARLLGMSRRNLYYKLERLGLNRQSWTPTG